MLKYIILASLSAGVLPACHQTNRNKAQTAAVVKPETPGSKPLITEIAVHKLFQAGQFFEAPIDPTREIAQITVVFSGSYSLPVLSSDKTKPMLNDEGRPMYKDGMYAQGFVVNDAGAKVEIARKKFIDSKETDNWHDLTKAKGSKLRIEFAHSEKYANDPEVKAYKGLIELTSIKIQYADDPRETYKEYRFAKNDRDEFAKDAKAVIPSETFVLKAVGIPATHKIYRVDVRWGDSLPRLNGVYVAGGAHGSLSVDGAYIDGYRNVAAIESQTWVLQEKDFKKPQGSEHEINLDFTENARVFWVRVYSRP